MGQDNIARFGGDPGRHARGHVGGRPERGLHLVSPGSGGLFHRADRPGSYPTVRETTQADGAIQGEAFAQALGCTVPSEVLSCMRSRDWNQVLTALLPATEAVVEPSNRTVWRPVVDGVEIPDQPRTLLEAGLFHRVPTITGTTRDEGWVFVARSFPTGVSPDQYDTWIWSEFGAAAPNVLATYPVASFPSATDAMARLVGDVQFVCEARRLARAIERTGTPVFQYSYEYEIDALSLDRVIHGVESNILFGNAYVPPYAVHPLDAQDLALHAAMSGYWTRFAATGNPNADDLDVVHWPAFKHPAADGRGSDKLLVLASEIRADKRVQEDRCDFWEPTFLRSVIGAVPAWTP
jgi:para-nitrobenzyl esterase